MKNANKEFRKLALNSTFAEVVRSRRIQKGMSQIQLANLVGIGDSEISRIEMGKRLPRLDLALRLAHLFQFSLDEFQVR